MDWFILDNSKSMKNLFLFIILIQLCACNSSLKLIQTADKFAADGNYSDAADYYYAVYSTNKKNLRAKNGLQKNAQLVLDAKFGSFAKYVVEGSNEKALRQFFYCKDYYKNLKEVGIELEWQSHFNDLYEETKFEFISNQYSIGINEMNEKKYDKAEVSFSKIVEFDSSFNNISVLRLNTVIEPLYNLGLNFIKKENYKNAYYVLSKISILDANFKNTSSLLNLSLQKCHLPIAVQLINKNKFSLDEDLDFYKVLINQFKRSRNPFLKVLDNDNFNKLLKDQELGINEIVDVNSASKAGKIINAKYFLLIDVKKVIFNELIPTNYNETAYESYTERVIGQGREPQSVVKFKKVNYTETRKFRKVEVVVSYQLISVESGQVITSDLLTDEKGDAHGFARFNGNVDNLYPSLPAGNFMPTFDPSWRESFYELDRALISNTDLSNKTFEEISSKILKDIDLYIQ